MMRVTLKAVNDNLAALGAKTELAKGAGYFFFRGGEAEDWIERTVRVPTIGTLTLEDWLGEYKRLKTVNAEMMKAPAKAFPRAANPQKQHHEAKLPAGPTHEAPHHAQPDPDVQRRQALTHAAPARTPAPRAARSDDSNRKGPCAEKPRLLAELDQAHRNLVDIEKEEVRVAREGKVSDLVSLSTAASRERSKFDRALLAVRDHTLVHGC